MALHDQITFVLVRTRFASNLGSAVRVIRNMGFSRLLLVQPRCEVGMEARSWAMRGVDVLDQARFAPSVAAAGDQIGPLVGTSGVIRGRGKRPSPCRSFCESLLPRLATSPLGIVFGPEDGGLSHAESRLCQWLIEIPTGSSYSSLNLAQSVAIVAYEMHLTLNASSGDVLDVAGPAEIETLLGSFSRLAESVGPGVSSSRALSRLRRIVSRAQLEKADIRMLMGLLEQIRHSGENESRP